ncbi:MAG: tRNA pseudouridine(38-40) synthase TruA [Clostridia bacterium]|mgnify:CR=1 FL=1|nr:tRNA pseudouridine(38-40) synthase TruA [Clostridia bacterium]MBQ6906117.1 tRNA pseudouridine(38-40) synthase TruA [Clostridia bacterium]
MVPVVKIRFVGTNYSGWQVQKNARSVQETLQDGLEKLLGKRYSVSGCSRTDSGVHANEYYAHLGSDFEFADISRLPIALNGVLPDDIAVTDAFWREDGFHARYSSLGKEYIYVIRNSKIRDPFFDGREFFYPKKFDPDRAREACEHYIGKKDFSSFMASHSKIEDAVRTVSECELIKEGDDRYIFRVKADGFLYNMVRIMVGTMIYHSAGSLKMDIDEIIESKNRANAGFTAPAHGLYLNKVFY